jgi:hypothetical protein
MFSGRMQNSTDPPDDEIDRKALPSHVIIDSP